MNISSQKHSQGRSRVSPWVRAVSRRSDHVSATLVAALVAIAFAQISTLALAQPLPGTPDTAPAPPATIDDPVFPAPAQAAPPTVLARSARAAGIRRCYPAIDQTSGRVFGDAERADVVLDWDRNGPDTAPFFSLSGLQYESGSALFSLTTAPSLMGDCSILAERIYSEPVACREVARSELQGYQGTPLVKAVTVYTAAGHPRETVTLVDAPPSCLVVRRQVRFGWETGQ